MRRKILGVAVTAAALVPTAAAPADAQAACAHADSLPSQATVAQLRAATICLVNVERRQRGRRSLRANHGLTVAGQRHARDMVRKRYFSHSSRSGRDFQQRIVRTGYTRRGAALLGENLAWGTRRLATPRAVVRGWMNSPGHRANILRPKFRHIGIGVVKAAPTHAAGGATYAAEFGRRYF
jgi:uncharacterized protein YkwD